LRSLEAVGSIEEAVFDILKLENKRYLQREDASLVTRMLPYKILESCQEYSKDRIILMAHTKTSNYL
jgi:hypothetical protein